MFNLVVCPASAATYYVNASNGKDTNNGLPKAGAWKTNAKVNASRFKPRDKILFKRGDRGDVWRNTLDDFYRDSYYS
jgi:hypothetical protein